MKTDSGLENVPERVWQFLAAGAGAWRVPVLASADRENGGDARIVVLRTAEPAQRRLTFFTDRRSRKYTQLLVRPNICLLVYDAAAGWQVRLYGATVPVTDSELLGDWWQGLAERQRRHYAQDANGKGRDNFVAFNMTVDRFHCLWLRDDGNTAAEFDWRDGVWSGRFVRP